MSKHIQAYSTPAADLLFVGAGKPSGTHPAKWTLKHWAGSPFKDHASEVPGGKDLPRSYLIDGLGRCVDVPAGYSLLSAGTADKVSEEEAETIMETVDYSEGVYGYEPNAEGYPVYDSGKDPDGTWKYLTSDPVESLHSLSRSLNLNPSETVVLYKLKN